MSTLPKITPQPELSREALSALERAGFSRRAFLRGAGALIVTFSTAGVAGVAFGQGQGRGGGAGRGGAAPDPGAIPANQLDSWVAIGTDGRVTAHTGKVEFGQGIATAQTQLVAEELCVAYDRVTLIAGDTGITPNQGVTSGSQTHPTNFNHGALALACATARETLVKLASERLSVPADQLTVANGVVTARTDSSRRVSYGELVGGRKFQLQLDTNAKRKPHAEWTVLGRPARRADIAPIVTGQFEYVHNVRLPGMLHGKVVRPPTVGATVAGVDESSVAGMPGLVKIVRKENFVGVVAEKPWQAIQIAEKLKVTWTPGPTLPPFATFYEHIKTQPVRDTLLVDSKDVEQTMAAAPIKINATYRHPYQMHGSLGTSCAVADVQGDRATLYSPTQGVWPNRSSSAMLLGLPLQNVRVVYRRGSGCYGLNGADTVTFDAALLSQAVNRPVRVQLSRKDEMVAGENYGLPFVIEMRAGLDNQSNIVGWDCENWSAAKGGRPGANNPGNVITGALAGVPTPAFQPRTPSPEPMQFNNGTNGIPSYFVGNVGNEAHGSGTIKSERVMTHVVRSAFYTAPLRSPARLQNTFAHESFMDEMAARVKADPVAFRLKHLRDPRLAQCVREAARVARWETRPSPRPGNRRTGIAAGRGISCVFYETENGYAAMVAEVDVNQDTGEIIVKRIVTSNDSGPISNPDGLRNQMEGGTLQGMSRALREEVTWDNEKLTSVDWASYRSLPLGFAVPTIECVLINNPEHETMGAGETAITIVAAAIGNAVFDATGARLRQVPFTPENVKAALAQRT